LTGFEIDSRHPLTEEVPMSTIDEAAITGLLDALTLEEKVRILTGRDSWSLYPLPSIGLRSIVVSDGPAGVRGDTWDERHPSVSFPSPTSVSASWDRSAVRALGSALGAEARRKGVDVVLAPTINIQRSPYGGRHFEAFSEDPLLTAETAIAYVQGIQSHGVGATIKHYVANDAETERFTASSDVDERTLREVYLAAFEGPVVEGGVWLVMSAYNAINGTTASENELLTSPLKDEWAFDGVVISDWTAIRSLESARQAQDLAMPGPDSPWARGLLEAVRNGTVEESSIDDKVRRLLRLAARVGAIDGMAEPTRAPLGDVSEAIAVSRAAASAGAVLLRNDGLLPLSNPGSIALIGEGAVHARIQGGGSATVIPASASSPLDGITERWPDASITWSRGAVVQAGLAALPVGHMTTPEGKPGLRVRYLDAAGAELASEVREASRIVSFDAESRALRATIVEFALKYSPDDSGTVFPFGLEGVCDYRVTADGVEVAAGSLRTAPGDDPAAGVLYPPYARVDLPHADGGVDVVVEFRAVEGGIPGAIALGVGTPPVSDASATLIANAARAAAEADIAIVVVSTSSEVESEGFDRTSLALPGDQDALVRAVLAANSRTIVVVNSGSPVILPWRDDAAAILATWFPGQEFGRALADMLSGDVEPGGRLPVSWPGDEKSVPVSQVAPTNGHLAYTEGVHVGYRAWLKSGSKPAFAFGHGLGYVEWDVSDATAVRAEDSGHVLASVDVHNLGDRAGKAVVQWYLEAPDPKVADMPVRWLAAYETITVQAGARATVSATIPKRRFARWDSGWRVDGGTYVVRAGLSSEDLRGAIPVQVPPERLAR
jgi:beta-glucosidase